MQNRGWLLVNSSKTKLLTNPKSNTQNPASKIQNQKSKIQHPKSKIQTQDACL
jgi:hypothetical protein